MFYCKTGYPEALRRIRFKTDEGKTLVFLTNNFALPAMTITELYRCRWQVELFFKWIKQHLRIKSFFGTSENAVKTQVWIAISVYVLVAIVENGWSAEKARTHTLSYLKAVDYLIGRALHRGGRRLNNPKNERPEVIEPAPIMVLGAMPCA